MSISMRQATYCEKYEIIAPPFPESSPSPLVHNLRAPAEGSTAPFSLLMHYIRCWTGLGREAQLDHHRKASSSYAAALMYESMWFPTVCLSCLPCLLKREIERSGLSELGLMPSSKGQYLLHNTFSEGISAYMVECVYESYGKWDFIFGVNLDEDFHEAPDVEIKVQFESMDWRAWANMTAVTNEAG